MSMIFCPLFSGSSGNTLYVEYNGTRLLVDAGKSGKMILDALQFIGVDPGTLDGILITHEHNDHIAGAGILSRRLQLPVYASEETWLAMEAKLKAMPEGCRRVFTVGQDFYIGSLGVAPFAIPHDAADPCGFRLWGGQTSVSTATDLGYFPDSVLQAIGGSDLVLLESNHDPDMLMANDHYSERLKRRILGRNGHLSNEAAAEAVVSLVESGVHNVVLGHLSGENNRPALALETSENRAEIEGIRLGKDLCLDLAWRDRVGGVYTISRD